MNAPRIGGEVIDGEAVLIDFVSGAYFSLRGPGVVVWQTIVDGGTVTDAQAAVRASHDGDVQAMDEYVDALVEELVGAGLLTSSEDAAPAPDGAPDATANGGASADERPAFEPMPLEKFTDMEQLLLLDPIHEVDEAGWPVVPTE